MLTETWSDYYIDNAEQHIDSWVMWFSLISSFVIFAVFNVLVLLVVVINSSFLAFIIRSIDHSAAATENVITVSEPDFVRVRCLKCEQRNKPSNQRNESENVNAKNSCSSSHLRCIFFTQLRLGPWKWQMWKKLLALKLRCYKRTWKVCWKAEDKRVLKLSYIKWQILGTTPITSCYLYRVTHKIRHFYAVSHL